MRVIAPSFHRASLCSSHKTFDTVEYAVCETEAKDYKKQGLKVIPMPSGFQGKGASRARNWILRNVGQPCYIIDDDIKWIGRWEAAVQTKLKGDRLMENLNAITELAVEGGFVLWGMNVIFDKKAYAENTPFSLSSIVWGPFTAHLGHGCLYDENILFKDDVDFYLTVINKHRRVLRANFLHYECDQHGTMKGGYSKTRTVNGERRMFARLERKWGSRIVQTDLGQTGSTSRKKKPREFDIDPIIRVPIPGI